VNAREIYRQMPEDARRRVDQTGPFRDALIGLWAAVQDYEQALERGELWARKRESERLRQQRGDVDPVEQDALDEKLVQRCAAGEYGRESQEAVQEIIESGRFGDRRATLRAAREAVWQVRNGAGRRMGVA
jgi:hypothetical protein